jgi:PhnB protein
MASIQPQLWVDSPRAALTFYDQAFGAQVVLLVGDQDDIVAQLTIGEAVFWVAMADPGLGRVSPGASATGRILLVVDHPSAVVAAAKAAGATELSPVEEEHGWLVGRIRDPFGHEWEIGRPTN